MPATDTRVVLGRRPRTKGEDPFGFAKPSAGGRQLMFDTLVEAVNDVQHLKAEPYHPDDQAGPGEILVGNLAGIDAFFQKDAPWSLERLIGETRQTGQPKWLTYNEIETGGWTFYAISATVDGQEATLVRAQSAFYGLGKRIMTVVAGNELKVLDDPILGFDGRADAVVIDDKVYVAHPRQIERLFIDADAVKKRAPATTAAFEKAIAAGLTSTTTDSILRVCQKNSNVARRVERLVRDDTLKNVTEQSIRDSLSDANEKPDALGVSGPLVADNDRLARLLIDLAADLYYQPRYVDSPRRVAAYRNLS